LLYMVLMAGADAQWPEYWPYVLPSAFILYSAFAAYTHRPSRTSLAVFSGGLLIAWAVRDVPIPWLHMLYIPYVSLAGAFGPTVLLWALVSVPALEAWHLLGGGPMPEEAAILVLCLVAAGISVSTRWNSMSAASRPRRRADAMARPEPPDTSGLEEVEDPETRDFLRTVLYTMKADAVSLYLLEDGEDLMLSASSTLDEERAAPQWFVMDALRFRHLVTADDLSSLLERRSEGEHAPGRPYSSGVVAAAAVPVIDGNVILGVLAMSSRNEGAFGEAQHMALELLAGQFARTLGRGRVQAETETHIERLQVIQEESARLVTSLDMMAIVEMVSEAIGRLAPEADLYLLVQGKEGYTLAYDRAPVKDAREVVDLEGTLTEMAVSDREHKYFSNLMGYSVPVLPMEGLGEVASALMLPLKYEDEVLGVAVLAAPVVDALKPRQVDSLRVVADQAAISLKNALFHAEIKARALTDGLTGLCNHKHFRSILEDEVSRYSKSMNPLSLLILDIDHFKQVNDTYGHLAGDDVLRGVAGLLKSMVREQDLPARYGGEEFAVLMPGTDALEARRMAERIRENVESTVFPARGNSLRITMSIGLASCTIDIKDPADLVERADQALYEAKAGGRNRTVVAGGLDDVHEDLESRPGAETIKTS
jgi:diguanylate cyclase (GGDEF)-like protein